MKISDKTVSAVRDTIDVGYCHIGGPAVLRAREAAEACISSYMEDIWNKYDKNNPPDKYAPSGFKWVVREIYSGKKEPRTFLRKVFYRKKHWDLATHYADPVDLFPSDIFTADIIGEG